MTSYRDMKLRDRYGGAFKDLAARLHFEHQCAWRLGWVCRSDSTRGRNYGGWFESDLRGGHRIEYPETELMRMGLLGPIYGGDGPLS